MTEQTETNAIDALIDGGFAETVEVAPADDVVDEKELQEEVEEVEAEEELEEEPEAEQEEEPAKNEKPLPRGKRAREEYEARVRLQIENENLKKSIAMMAEGKKETPKDAPVSDDDYLRAKGIDPDNFIDDTAKAALILTMKENDSLKEMVTKTAGSTEDANYQGFVSNVFNSLPDEAKQDLSGALNHLIETEAQALLLEHPNATIDDARAAAKNSLNDTMSQKFKSGVHPLEWAYKLAKTRAYAPALTKPVEGGKLNVKQIAESQKRAGTPNVEKVQLQTKVSDVFGDSYINDLKSSGMKI